ncbi:hypothetical protein FA95DRAFT_1533022 [Auriscalpium vulgare]|uniref:Uncharacterized protein n=1 Tax=Auriscalpium vulgare TaxID=40419 RepID=A0ACB8S7U3_9AGAM|nr:hypothetical protein FA95DRAFT_1533022 [Auriscalpium vulgare]
MSAALNQRADTSGQSIPDLSLGSVLSGFSTPAKSFRIPSTSSQTTAPSSVPVSTPSPPHGFMRRKGDEATPLARRLGLSNHDEDDIDSDVLNTAQREKRWEDEMGTPLNGRGKRRSSAANVKSTNLTLRDQEKHIDNLKKENFNIKLKVHFLEERLAQLAPDQVESALKQNINLKIEVQQRGMDLKKLRKLVLELERELEQSQKGAGRSARERELEALLQERDREIRELRRRRAVGPDDAALRDAEERNSELEEELENVRRLLEENMDELERLKDIVERRDDTGGDGRQLRRMDELEMEIEELKAALEEHADLLAQRDEEKEELLDQQDALRLQLEDVERRREAESIERSQSRAMILEEREERQAAEDDVNTLRDKLAAASIELQQKEDEIGFKSQEISELINEHQSILDDVEGEWKGEVDEAKTQIEELRDALADRDAESEELRMQIADFEANNTAMHEKYEAAFAHLEREAEEKDEEIALANREIEQLGQRIYELEEDTEELKRVAERDRAEEAVERERLEALCAALKDKVANLKAELEEVTRLYEDTSQDIIAHRARQEELARHVQDLVAEVNKERDARESVQADLDASSREFDADLRRERRALEAKESALQTALADLARAQALLTQREADLAAVQGALQAVEAESKKLGESHTTARFSLQLETDRLRRDVERLEDELTRARADLDARSTSARERDGAVDKLHAENRDLAAQLAAQTQARLNVAEKLDAAQAGLAGAEAELAGARARAGELESRLSKDQRSLLAAESQYRDQLTERNTLLLTIYQYMDRILGVDKTPKKSGQAETKPFTNFGVFHDNLITRLKSLSQIQLDFDKRVKDAEMRYAEKMTEMRKSLDNRWKQIDKFEASLKVYADTKATWRRKLSAKEGELDAAKTTMSELTSQLASLKRPGPGDSNEVKALMARANNAERRLVNAQNQLAAAEEKMASMNQKTTAADTKWEARVKEYESRLRAAEEKVKREKQGYKERVLELETQLKSLQRQKELADKRNQQLTEIEAKAPRLSGSPNVR